MEVSCKAVVSHWEDPVNTAPCSSDYTGKEGDGRTGRRSV